MQPCHNPTDEAYELIHRVNSLIMDKGPKTVPCGHCGEPMQKDKDNKNKQYCSGRCRVAAHRKRTADRQRAIGTQKVVVNA